VNLYIPFFRKNVVHRASIILHEARHSDGKPHVGTQDPSWGFQGSYMWQALWLAQYGEAAVGARPDMRAWAVDYANWQIDNKFVTHPGFHFSVYDGPIVGLGGNCVDLQWNNAVNGQPIWMYTCNDGSAQTWKLRQYGTDPHAQPVIELRDNMCLDVKNGTIAQGQPIQLWQCNGTHAQRWIVDGQYIRLAGNPAYCLDVQWGNPAIKTPLHLWPCMGNSAQRFTFEDSDAFKDY
jgi:hypothetical protein